MNDERQHNRANGNGIPGGLPLDALLSAYLDDRESLQPEERARVETLLASDAEAQRMYAELQVVVRELGRLEAVPAPRSYHLDAEMVGAPEPVQMTATSAWYARHASVVRWATAAAAVIFVFVLSADLVLNGVFSNPSSSGDDAGSMVEQSQLSGEREAADDGGLESASGAAAATDAGAEDSGAADADGAVEESDDADGGDESSSAEAETLAEPPVEPEADEPEDATDAGGGSDAFDGAADEEQAEEELSPEPIPTAEIAIAEESDDGAGGDADSTDAPVADDSALDSGDDTARTSEEAAGESDDEAAAPDTLAFDEAAANEDGGSDRQLWRIAEFSLVVILALLITAMIILPRMARAPTRR